MGRKEANAEGPASRLAAFCKSLSAIPLNSRSWVHPSDAIPPGLSGGAHPSHEPRTAHLRAFPEADTRALFRLTRWTGIVSAVDDPQITTVIPTFRRPRLLRRAVESVLAQTYPHLEVAVVDNASGDETSEVVADLARRDPRVRYSCHSENLGPVANFQAGMDSVTTPYFSFLCDDDLLLPDFYRHALECIRREPRAGFFCGQTVIYDSELGSHYVKPTRPWSNGLYEAGRTTARMVDAGFIWTAVLFALEV